MTETVAGIFIGVATSFLAGIVLIWRGDQIVRHFRRLPEKRRVSLYTLAYLKAIRSYPYRYAHMITMMTFAILLGLLFISYVVLIVIAFSVDFSLPPESVKESVRTSVGAPANFVVTKIFNPWILIGITAVLVFISRSIVFKTIPSELLVPYAHRELTRLRECVAKCSTKKQFLEYTDHEHNVRNIDDLKSLVAQAKKLFGTVDLKLADEILEGLYENFPELETRPESAGANKTLDTDT